MSTKLGKAKIYFLKSDFGKMLKLEDISNLAITNVENNGDRIEITIVTPMDNGTNNRVRCVDSNNNLVTQTIVSPSNFYTFEDNSYGTKGAIEGLEVPEYLTIKDSSGKEVGKVKKSEVKFYNTIFK